MSEIDGMRQFDVRADMVKERQRAMRAESATQQALKEARAAARQAAAEHAAAGEATQRRAHIPQPLFARDARPGRAVLSARTQDGLDEDQQQAIVRGLPARSQKGKPMFPNTTVQGPN